MGYLYLFLENFVIFMKIIVISSILHAYIDHWILYIQILYYFKCLHIFLRKKPDTNFKRLTHCQYFDTTSFKSDFKNGDKMSIFHTNIRSSAKNLSQLKCYLGALEFNFSIIGISENWGTRENINVQTIPG